MLSIFKKLAGVALLGATALSAHAFTVWGPLESWQVSDLNYGAVRYFNGAGELGGPKNFGEGSRLNVPIITYAYDYTFLNYFGTQGVKAIDAAFAVLNGLPAASAMNLSRFNTDGIEQVNYTAQAMGLVDLKSAMMGCMMEHMGLLGETHVFDLHGRVSLAPSCTFDYYVINRNYDPVTFNPSDYVNGRHYSYIIEDDCPTPSVGDAVETLVDSTVPISTYTAVATKEALLIGGLYYTSISRDDAGGLRYLYRRNNFNNESLDPDAVIGTSGSGFQIVNPSATNSPITNTSGIYGGVEKIRYVKVAFESLIGTNFNTLSYRYSIPAVVNGQISSLQVTRTISQPDIIITAADLANEPASPLYARSVNFISNNVTSIGGGISSQVIAPQMVVTFNTIGAVYFNTQPYYLDQNTAEFYPDFIWASFDGSSNAPVIFPSGSSIVALEQEVMSGSSYVTPGTYNPVIGSSTNSTTNTSTVTTLP